MKSWLERAREVFGRIPPGLDAADDAVRWETVRRAVPWRRSCLRVRTYQKSMPAFLAAAPQRCEELRGAVAATTTGAALAALWRARSSRTSATSCRMLGPRARLDGRAGHDPRDAAQDGGRADANALLTGLTAAASWPASACSRA